MQVTIFWYADFKYFNRKKVIFDSFFGEYIKKILLFAVFEDYGPSSQSSKSFIGFLNPVFLLVYFIDYVFNKKTNI